LAHCNTLFFSGTIFFLVKIQAFALILRMKSDDPQFICRHLAEGPTDIDMFVWFTGHGKDLNWTCRACAEVYPTAPDLWVPATQEWLAMNGDEFYWDGICGRPEVKHRLSGLSFANRELELEGRVESFVDVRPIVGSPSCWQALSSTGRLLSFNSCDGKIISSVLLESPGFEITRSTGLCLSHEGEFGVIFQTSGSEAALMNLKSGKIIRKLSRGDDCSSRFSAGFFRYETNTYLIAASAWNRLDLYDPSSGKMLTERGPTQYVGDERPLRYLDYFHGGLSISPDQQHIVDNGWAWHPFGILRSWSLPAWIHNVWESEDGASSRELVSRAYYSDGPLCWIDNTTIAFWGWGRDDDWLIPAAVLVDVRNGSQLSWFPGPAARKAVPSNLAESFFFDRYLFTVHDDDGTTVWDIESGECLLTDPQVKPWRYHPDSKEFIEIKPTTFKVSTLMS
jgi:hypothetical protein